MPAAEVYREHPAPASVSTWVETAWSGAPTTISRVPPDGCLDIVYSPSAGLRAVGAMTVEHRFESVSPEWHCGVRFRSDMAREFLRISSAELTDLSVPLADILGRAAARLERRLQDQDAPDDCAALLIKWLIIPRNQPNPAQRAIGAIAEARGLVNLEEIASQAGLSARQFRRRCLEESGLTPKYLCRILRFRRAYNEAFANPDWADIAALSGYFDQAHLIRDFREFTGRTPMAVFSNRALPQVA
ncbi:MAG TPA: helix-turn-helix domain-containing protein [Bryobacteraceae bacterium]|nr:helix-turn-helix domain-containing protein [Bryobacteraceae bacterium]